MKTSKTFKNLVLIAVICAFIYACNGNKNVDIAYEDTVDTTLDISYYLPGDLNVDATERELALFAWKEFFALNWQSSWTKDSLRTVADSTWNFATGGAQPDLAVWETYIHRIELRPANATRTKDLTKGLPYYTFIDSTKVNVGPDAIDLDKYWNVLDEDNEIGSAYLFAHENEYEVLYAAKSNLVEYNYIKDNFPTDTELYAASNKGSGTAYLKTLSNAQMCATDSLTSKGVICLPCGDNNGNAGVLEIKLAFRKLDASKGDDSSRFITKEVVNFTNNKTTGNIDANVDTFGLIGMHIIRKTKNYPAFVFASWEQVDARNDDMQTIGLDLVKVNDTLHADVDPHRLNPVIERVIPETLQDINSYVHNTIKGENSASKWQYYQLIGVQATPLDYVDRTGDNNYFMANYVIESDLTLTNFHGSFSDPFNKTLQNVVCNKRSYNMGGCQGCHGQAQKSGTDFSFLLDNAGKPVATPDIYQTYEEAYNSAQPKDLLLNETEVKKMKTYFKTYE